MSRVTFFAAFAISLMSVGTGAERAEAQATANPAVVNAAQAAAGTARVLDAHLFADSVVVAIEDADLAALMEGAWRFGGLEGTPRQVGRAIAEAVRSALPGESRANFIVLNVSVPAPTPPEDAGLTLPVRGTSVRFPYSFADQASR